MKLQNVAKGVTRFFGRTGLKIQKYSPEILIVTGVGAVIGGTVMACKATLHAHEVLEEREKMIDEINDAIDFADENSNIDYPEEKQRKDRLMVTVWTGKSFIKLYAPAAGILTGGLICILASYGILKKRNAALAAAYMALDKAFNTYRARVIADKGPDKDIEYMYGRKQAVEVVDEETGEIVKDDTKPVVTGDMPSLYAKFFDESNPNYVRNAERNKMFLVTAQNYANDLLQTRGHVFLNEVYDMIGIDHTQAGAIVGWIKGMGDDFIDFGIYNVNREKSRDFVNGYENAILLDFNVQGPIWNLI